MENQTYTTTATYESPADERRRPVKRYQIPPETRPGSIDSVSNHPFTGMLIAATAKASLPALRRSIRSKYERHVGAKQREKMLGIYRSNLSELARPA